MKVDQEKSEFLDEMLQHWRDEKLLTDAEVSKLKSSYEIKTFDWRRLAHITRREVRLMKMEMMRWR